MEFLKEIDHIVGGGLINDDGTIVSNTMETMQGDMGSTLPPNESYSSEVNFTQPLTHTLTHYSVKYI